MGDGDLRQLYGKNKYQTHLRHTCPSVHTLITAPGQGAETPGTPGCPGAPPARWPPPRPPGSSVACSEVRADGPTPRVLLVAAVLPCTRCAPDGESHREGRVTSQRAHPGCFPGSRGLGAQVPATERSGSRGPEQRAPPSRVVPAVAAVSATRRGSERARALRGRDGIGVCDSAARCWAWRGGSGHRGKHYDER